jgi:hypothetical protein
MVCWSGPEEFRMFCLERTLAGIYSPTNMLKARAKILRLGAPRYIGEDVGLKENYDKILNGLHGSEIDGIVGKIHSILGL